MALSAWPTTLPTAPLVEGYAETYQDQKVRSSMDIGAPKVRRRFTASVRGFKVSFKLSKAQVQILEDFFFTTLEGGSLSFDWKHPRTGAALVLRFVGTYSVESITVDEWAVQAEMENLP